MTIAEAQLLLGNSKLMNDQGIELADYGHRANQLAEAGKTPMFIARNGQLAGIIAVADPVKANSQAAIKQLHRMGIETVMITGDNQRNSSSNRPTSGIDRVLSEVLPEDKAAVVKKLQSEGKKSCHGRRWN